MKHSLIDFKRIANLLMCMLVWLCFFISYLYPSHLPPWLTFYNEFIFSVGLLLFFVILVLGGQLALERPFLIFVSYLLFFGILCFVIFDVTDLMVGGFFVYFLIYGGVAVVCFVIGGSLKTGARFELVLMAVFGAGLVSAFISLMQWLGLLQYLQIDAAFVMSGGAGQRAHSNIGQANNLGTLLVISSWILVYFWLIRDRTLKWRVMVFFVLGILCLGIQITGSRTAFVNIILAPVLLMLWARFRGQSYAWQILLPIAWWCFWVLVLPYVSDALGWVLPEARSLTADNTRQRLWLMALTAVGDQPWRGYGFGGMANVHLFLVPKFGPIDYSIAASAHNIVLDMWVTFGVVLGSAVVGFFVWLWVRAWMACKTAADQFIWLMATAMIVHAMLEYPLHYGFFFWLLCLLLGALGGKPWKTVTFKRPLLAATVWLAVFGAGAFTVWRAYVDTESMYTLYRQQGATAAQHVLHEQRDSLGAKLYPELHARLFWLTTPMDEVSRLTDEQLVDLENEARYYPLPMLGWRVAFAQAYRGNAEQAAWWAERMCKMFDPQVCTSAQQEWLRRGESAANWPVLPWAQWLGKPQS